MHGSLFTSHDDVIKWKHVPCYWPFVRGIHWSPHKGQWREALMFSLICAWIIGCLNNLEAGDLRRHWVHYDVTVMMHAYSTFSPTELLPTSKAELVYVPAKASIEYQQYSKMKRGNPFCFVFCCCCFQHSIQSSLFYVLFIWSSNQNMTHYYRSPKLLKIPWVLVNHSF